MSEVITRAIIPAAGLGTRMLPATKSQPKEMLPVARKPVVQYVVEELQGAGLHQILVITGRRKRAIEDHFDPDPDLLATLERAGNESLLGELTNLQTRARFFYTSQASPRGLGDAIALGAEFANDEDCVVALGDSLIAGQAPAEPLRAMMKAHVDLKAAAIVAVERVPAEETFRYGIVSPACSDLPEGEPIPMQDIVEKPPRGTAPSDLAVAARYVFSPAIFEVLPRVMPDRKGEIQLTDGIRLLVQKGLPIYAWLLLPENRRYDVGNFESYFRTFIDFALADEQYGYMVRQYIKAKAYEL